MKISTKEAKILIEKFGNMMPDNIDKIIKDKIDGEYSGVKVNFVDDDIIFDFPNTIKGSISKTFLANELAKIRKK